MIKDRFGSNVVLIQYPVEAGPGFESIIDVLKMDIEGFITAQFDPVQ